MKLFLTLFFIFTLTFLLHPPDTHAIETKTYIQWWPVYTTPWAYPTSSQIGFKKFLHYDRASQYAQLKADFDAMITTHKPDMIQVLITLDDLLPLKVAHSIPGAKLPEGSAALDQVRPAAPIFTYFDDLIYLAERNDIEIVLYLVVSPYGGMQAYPYSYVSKTGWFWQRPDWSQGLANPNTDAMRHPPACSDTITTNCIPSTFNWIEHEAGYTIHPSHQSFLHLSQTSNGTEDTGSPGPWQVFEAPNMVFNGYDTVLGHWGGGAPVVNLHSPIPSLSSTAYRNFVSSIFQSLASHYKDAGILGYYLFQEPTAAHLRENIARKNGDTKNTNAGDATWYETDYSQAELFAYNAWRETQGKADVDQIPYPIDTDYNTFRHLNLAGLLLRIQNAIRAGDPDARTLLSLFYDDNLNSTLNDPNYLIPTLKSELLIVEGDNDGDNFLFHPTRLDQVLNLIQNQSPATKTYISYLNRMPASGHDPEAASALAAGGFTHYYAPAVISPIDPAGYPHWGPNACADCTFRYQNPGTPAPAPMPGTSPTPNPSITTSPKPGDVNGDGHVNGLDYVIFFTEWGKTVPPGDPRVDFNSDAVINGLDYIIIFQNWDPL